MSRKLWVMAVAALLETGCLVRVTHVSEPGTAFGEARAEALRFAERAGPASELNVLAWDPRDGEMTRISVPLWLLRKADRSIDWDDMDLDPQDERRRKKMSRRLRWEDIEKAAPGILLEVLEDEGERVLVWLR